MTPSQQLLRYRPWRGEFHGPMQGTLAVARVGLMMLLRRKLFWGMYGLSVMIFLFFFYGQYLQVFLEQRVTDENIRTGGLFPQNIKPELVLKRLRDALQLNGSADTYANLIWFEGYIVMVILALVGSVLVGNDFRYGSMPFYLSKPIHRWHYVLGKCLAVGVFINLMTTLPAVILFLEYGFIDGWDYYRDQSRLLIGILTYGLAMTVTLSLLLVATASWVRRTVPMVMLWTAIFVLGRILQRWLVDGLKLAEEWRLVDLWNNLYLVGQWALGTPRETIRPTSQVQPPYPLALLVLVGVVVGCLLYLRRRIRAVEVIT